jgi:hypothetical protein
MLQHGWAADEFIRGSCIFPFRCVSLLIADSLRRCVRHFLGKLPTALGVTHMNRSMFERKTGRWFFISILRLYRNKLGTEQKIA